MYAHKKAWAAATLLFVALVLVAARERGASGRVVLPSHAIVTVRSSDEAFRVWKDAGVRGRILLLFDAYPHLTMPHETWHFGEGGSAASLTELAVFENVVRKVYWVVPEADWEAFRSDERLYQPLRGVPGAARATYLLANGGIPFIAAAPSSLPRLSEEALVFVNEARFDPREVAALLASRRISSDLVVVLRGGAAP